MSDAEDSLFARKQAISSCQTMCTANLHDTGAFVIFKKQRALNTPRRHHNTVSPDFDIAFIEVIGFTTHLKGGDEIVVVCPNHSSMNKTTNVGCFRNRFCKFPGSFE